MPIKILLIISLFLFFLFLNFIFTAGPLTQPATSCHGIRGVVERFIESWNGECTFLTSILKFVLLCLYFLKNSIDQNEDPFLERFEDRTRKELN